MPEQPQLQTHILLDADLKIRAKAEVNRRLSLGQSISLKSVFEVSLERWLDEFEGKTVTEQETSSSEAQGRQE